MGTTITKGITMCHEYICSNCEYSFYYPINSGTDATDEPYRVICPHCGSDSCY